MSSASGNATLSGRREEILSKYPFRSSGFVREAWVETLDTTGPARTGEIVPLHPDIWSVRPRIDIIQANVEWQNLYKKVGK